MPSRNRLAWARRAALHPHHPIMSGLADAPVYSKDNPFPARLVENRLLNKPGSSKETRHFVVNMAGSGLSYVRALPWVLVFHIWWTCGELAGLLSGRGAH